MEASSVCSGCLLQLTIELGMNSPEEDKALENALASHWDRPDRHDPDLTSDV